MSLGSWAYIIGIIIGLAVGIWNPLSVLITWIIIGLGVIIGVLAWMYNDAKYVFASSMGLVLLSQWGPNALINANMMINMLYWITIMFIPVALISAVKLVVKK